ncbi:hypothetical protein [Streptomyces sp. NPDC093544]|uniref:hypothetical protein n=1 Tax=Streptomyces sp. NPDC093544 TaxID=3155200 RepID=UPI00341898FC
MGIRQSCGCIGSCFDNAVAESFWALLKEEIGTRIWPDRATARTEVFAFIETFYNRRRLRKRKVFCYLTPAETRQRHQHALAAGRVPLRGVSDLARRVPVSRASATPWDTAPGSRSGLPAVSAMRGTEPR